MADAKVLLHGGGSGFITRAAFAAMELGVAVTQKGSGK